MSFAIICDIGRKMIQFVAISILPASIILLPVCLVFSPSWGILLSFRAIKEHSRVSRKIRRSPAVIIEANTCLSRLVRYYHSLL